MAQNMLIPKNNIIYCPDVIIASTDFIFIIIKICNTISIISNNKIYITSTIFLSFIFLQTLFIILHIRSPKKNNAAIQSINSAEHITITAIFTPTPSLPYKKSASLRSN